MLILTYYSVILVARFNHLILRTLIAILKVAGSTTKTSHLRCQILNHQQPAIVILFNISQGAPLSK